MLKNIRNTPIFRRLFYAFALATVIPVIAIALLGTYYLNSLQTRDQAVKTSFDAQSAASNQQVNLERMNALLQTRANEVFASLSGTITDPSLSASGALINDDIFARESDFGQALTSYQSNYDIATSDNMSTVRNIITNDDPTSTVITDQQVALEAVSKVQWPTYKQLQDKVLSQLDAIQEANLTTAQLNTDYTQIYQTLYTANLNFTSLKNNWQSVVDAAVNVGSTVTTVGPSQTNPILISTVAAVFFTLFVVFATGYVVNITITQPLRQLTNLTKRIAKGETTARATSMGRDEIHMVAISMNNMLDNIVRLIRETQDQRDNLQTQVEKLVSEVSGVGEGDLRIQAEVTADALGVLADSFNYMVEELGGLVVRVKGVANEVENSTASILDRMTQLVETGDIQLKQITVAAVEVERTADASRQVAERSQVLYTVARDARGNARGGREAVGQAIEGMNRIHENVQATAGKVQTLGERSREINNIVEAISNIAHQTNRLALDAAIQAAMAGENGKGFGAVAADIRRLAERAKDQASNIARIVRSVREDIGAAAVSMQDTERETSAGARLTQEAGAALESLFTAVEYQTREVENINQVALQQVQSSNAIVQIMQGISESTQQSSMSTREASHNMERLARLVEQLRSSVEAFKLRENQDYFVPSSSVSITPEDDVQDNQLTVSGIFRTVSALPAGQNGSFAPPAQQGQFVPPFQPMQPMQPALPPSRSADPFAYFPMTPNPQSNGGWDQPSGPDQPWPDEPFNGQTVYGNGNGNGNGNWNNN